MDAEDRPAAWADEDAVLVPLAKFTEVHRRRFGLLVVPFTAFDVGWASPGFG